MALSSQVGYIMPRVGYILLEMFYLVTKLD